MFSGTAAHGGGKMLLFLVKTYRTIRRIIAARRHPSQLAWGIAFGLLLGLVPHGNLLALALLIGILCLKLNHAAMGLTAIAVTFVASSLDPYSHRVGDWVLSHPSLQNFLSSAWSLPLVPWTDLNNTVVMGSFLIGLAALPATFLATYPVLKLFAPNDEDEQPESPTPDEDRKELTPALNPPHAVVPKPHFDRGRRKVAAIPSDETTVADAVPDFRQVESPAHDDADPPVVSAPPVVEAPSIAQSQHNKTSGTPTSSVQEPSTGAPQKWKTDASVSQRADGPHPEVLPAASASADRPRRETVETRIDVVRASETNEHSPEAMDEALNYLLRQLRDHSKGDAA